MRETIPLDGYDACGNLLKRQVIDAQGTLTYTYAYDDLYQLVSETGAADHSYQHDSLYNRIAKNEKPYTHNALNQLLTQTDSHYVYDVNGNLVKDGKASKCFTWYKTSVPSSIGQGSIGQAALKTSQVAEKSLVAKGGAKLNLDAFIGVSSEFGL